MLAERAPAGEAALPYATTALGTFALAVPALAASQLVWGLRARRSDAFERKLFAGPPHSPPARRAFSRLGVAAGWAVLVLLGLTLPPLFCTSGLYSAAVPLAGAARPLAMGGCTAAVCFTAWWAREVAVTLALAMRPGGAPRDPWDPDRGGRRAGGAVFWAAAAACAAALLGARAHLWEPGVPVLYALIGVTLAALVACTLVTDQ
jgi:hypothetical protein